ncbi:MAG: DUF3426 domain-containing protein [Alphaproteobacteria bacterium]|nr:DUF3426 domain-containing protein [Alphaproteobacteria bacterium]
MIITCPRCATRYLLEAGVVQPPGRQVRCARCTHTWFQDAAPDLPKPVLMEEPEVPAGPVTDKSRMLPAPPGSISQPIPRVQAPPTIEPPPSVRDDAQRATSRRWAAVLLLAALVIGGSWVFAFMRTYVATVFPPAARLYAALGVPVNTRGFDIKAQTVQEMANGVPVIAIKGEIINITDRELPVPKLNLRVLDSNKRELYRWTVVPDQPRLAGHQRQSFAARLESPPADTADIEIRLAKDTPDG